MLGCPYLILAVDHQPLVGVLNDRRLDTIENPRLLRLKEKTLMYSFKIVHIPGSKMCTPDTLSRHPTEEVPQASKEDEDAGALTAFAIQIGDGIRAITWKSIDVAASTDEECLTLVSVIQDGFPPTREKLPAMLRYYWPMRHELYVIGNTPFKNRKMLIPSCLRKEVLNGLHAAHQGVEGMLSNARQRFFWPGLDAAIRLRRAQCKQCDEREP